VLCSLAAIAAATQPQQPVIEVVVVGPAQARNQMEESLRPLLGATPDVRWSSAEAMPSEAPFPGADGQDTTRIWVDVSSPVRFRLYLPAEEPKDTTIVRTLARKPGDDTDADLLARETFAQMVKSAILTVQTRLARQAEEAEQQRRAEAERRRRADEDRGRQEARDHTRPFARLGAGLAHLSASESYENISDSYSQFGPTVDLALGLAIKRHLRLYGELAVTGVMNAADYEQHPCLCPYSKGNLVLVTFGPGVTYSPYEGYYLMGAFSFAKLWFFDEGETYWTLPDTDVGIGGRVGFGKEWLVGRSWALGVEGRIGYARLKHQFSFQWAPVYTAHYSPTVSTTAISLLFSATYD
jgi:hypothetical protein